MKCGFACSIEEFVAAPSTQILDSLKNFVPDAGESQIRAWRDSIKYLNGAFVQVLKNRPSLGREGYIVFEYLVPLESRRIDCLLLIRGFVLVIEFKGKGYAGQADLDQASAYGRDLRAYHRSCASLTVRSLLIPTAYLGHTYLEGDVTVVGRDGFAGVLDQCSNLDASLPSLEEFLSEDCYEPLPSLIKAARELFQSGSLRRIHRAAAATDPTLARCTEIIQSTAASKRRALILLYGVPGAGKTLVGLQLAHADFLDELAIARQNGSKSTSSAVYLSGNGPLVEVLQYELKSAGGDGKAFVRGVHDYVKSFTRRPGLTPPQHVLIYDEAQRAFDVEQVAAKHPDLPAEFEGLSEPELFIQFAERIPEWSVVIGLIGSGQEIHIGEEAGLTQWRSALENAGRPEAWDVFGPPNSHFQEAFSGFTRVTQIEALELNQTIRFHLATKLYAFVYALLEGDQAGAAQLSLDLEESGYTLRLTHDLSRAKAYLRARYADNPEARYGMLASSKDKDLKDYGIPKGFKSPGEVGPGKYGRWYSDPTDAPHSCASLNSVATEFGSQGLELDGCLLAWGTDFVRLQGAWSNRYASGYKEAARVRDAMALRRNAYRVLLTRGRDGCVIFVPPIAEKLRETYLYLRECGFKDLLDEQQ